jgi:hypothetical protein
MDLAAPKLSTMRHRHEKTRMKTRPRGKGILTVVRLSVKAGHSFSKLRKCWVNRDLTETRTAQRLSMTSPGFYRFDSISLLYPWLSSRTKS